jgi:hypothetical protein
VNPKIEESEPTFSPSSTTLGIFNYSLVPCLHHKLIHAALCFVTVDYRTSGSPIANFDGPFEFNSLVLFLVVITLITSLGLVIVLVVSSRSRLQDQIKLTVDGHEPIQETSGSPIPTGAPLNSHSLPSKQLSDSEDSDGADKDRFDCSSLKLFECLIALQD